MKVTKSQLRQIIKEEFCALTEGPGQVNNIGGRSGMLGKLGRADPVSPEDEAESMTRAKAMIVFTDLGLDNKVSAILVDNMAIPDLKTVMDAIPKIDTAAEGELGLHQVGRRTEGVPKR
jgi:hypothetical protein